jgi:hypothetical protein
MGAIRRKRIASGCARGVVTSKRQAMSFIAAHVGELDKRLGLSFVSFIACYGLSHILVSVVANPTTPATARDGD